MGWMIMASKTTNFNLTKPSATDFYDISVQNENMDIIDGEIKNLNDKMNEVDSQLLNIDGKVREDLESHKLASNPHNITAATVGLEKVPNLATNDQTPTFTEATTLTNLASGEKLHVALGKIKKAIGSLISHLADNTKHITSTERTNLNSHLGDNTSHITSAERTAWNDKAPQSAVNDLYWRKVAEREFSAPGLTFQPYTQGQVFEISGIDFDAYEEIKLVCQMYTDFTTAGSSLDDEKSISYGICESYKPSELVTAEDNNYSLVSRVIQGKNGISGMFMTTGVLYFMPRRQEFFKYTTSGESREVMRMVCPRYSGSTRPGVGSSGKMGVSIASKCSGGTYLGDSVTANGHIKITIYGRGDVMS
jgi:hypothetical protein